MLWALSTRFCLDPDLGVTLVVFKNAATGEVMSSLSRGPEPLALKMVSGLGRRGSGVATLVGFWC